MKKSTLITTIAMIVVVVVALSTATYAWFSSQSQTYATQTITTQTASEISVIVNDTLLLTTSTKATFNATALLGNTQHVTSPAEADIAGIREGLWAPYSSAALANRPDSNSSVDAVSNAVVSFMSGTQNQIGSQLTVTKAPAVTSADMIRVTNNKSTAKNIILTIYIAAVDNANSKFAAQGVSFYIHDNASFTANTAYKYIDSAVIASEAAEEADVIAINSTNFKSVSASNNITDSASANHRSTDTTVGTGFTLYTASNDATNAGLVSCDKGAFTSFYTLTINLGSFDSAASRNFLIYNWLDGTYLTDAAGNAGIGIAYSFAFEPESGNEQP